MNLSEVNWDFDAAGTWPTPIKIITILLISISVAGAWYYFDTQKQLAVLAKVEKREKIYKKRFEKKQRKAAALEDYENQLAEMEKSLGTMLRQLPDKTEVANLLVDVSQTGLASGLEFELFKPKGEIRKEFYAVLPINVRVIGGYEELGSFVSGLAALPRIVTIHNVKIEPRKKASGNLVMNAIVKTYRYVEDSAGSKKRRKKKKRGRKK